MQEATSKILPTKMYVPVNQDTLRSSECNSIPKSSPIKVPSLITQPSCISSCTFTIQLLSTVRDTIREHSIGQSSSTKKGINNNNKPFKQYLMKSRKMLNIPAIPQISSLKSSSWSSFTQPNNSTKTTTTTSPTKATAEPSFVRK